MPTKRALGDLVENEMPITFRNAYHPGDFELRRDLGDLLTATGDNIFLLKVSYRWNM